MSKKPESPIDDGPAGTGQEIQDIPPGRRFSGNDMVLEIEHNLVADGVDLPNRAIPVNYHAVNRTYTEEEIQSLIETEAKKENPNRQLIGYLNGLKDDL